MDRQRLRDGSCMNSEGRRGQPKRDGSGGGRRANQGRGGCKNTSKTGRGKNQ